MQYATLYLADPSLVGSKVLDTFPQIISYTSKSEAEAAAGMIIKLAEAEIDMNFMEPSGLENHLEGFKGFASKYVCKDIDYLYVLARIHYVRLPIGCVINPRFDTAGKVLDFLQKLNKAYNSLLFYDNKVFDYDMQMLVELKT